MRHEVRRHGFWPASASLEVANRAWCCNLRVFSAHRSVPVLPSLAIKTGELPKNETKGILTVMTTVKEIESAVKQLPRNRLYEFRKWFEEYDASLWDKQFDEDASSGKLDALADQAISSLKSKRCKEL